jgi:hypothetical protein
VSGVSWVICSIRSWPKFKHDRSYAEDNHLFIPFLVKENLESSHTYYLQSTTTMASHERHVNFGRVEIFEFPITLGDHPCVSNGPPVALEYYAMNNFVVPFHVYEMYRPEPRSCESFLLSGSARARSLAKNGFSREEIRLCALEAECKQIERRLSALKK